MRKYLQGLDLGGSLYGKKKQDPKKEDSGEEKKKEADDLASSYKKLYKSQVVMMNKVFKHEEEEYRVPKSVLKQLKEQLEVNPKLKFFKVNKTGEGMKTSYTVIPLVE